MDVWLFGLNVNKIEVVIVNNDVMVMGVVEVLKVYNKFSILVFGVDVLLEVLVLVKFGVLVGIVLNDVNN